MTARKETPRKSSAEPHGNAREKIIYAAIDLFGEYGFDGASIRDIAKKAGQNIGSISYYFGDKKGLYTAVAEEIITHMKQKLSAKVQEIEDELGRTQPTLEDYRAHMRYLVRTMVMALVQHDSKTRGVTLIFAREQFAPTHVLKIFYDRVHAPTQKIFCRLLAGALGKNPESEEIKVRSYTLFGMGMIFRMAREMVLLRTGWKTMGEREVKLIADIVCEHIDLIINGLHNKDSR